MITLRDRIEESLFGGPNLNKSLEELKRLTYMTMACNRSLWNNNKIVVGNEGIEIDARNTEFYISDFEKRSFDFHISRFIGKLIVERSTKVRDLEGLFTKNCDFSGTLIIQNNEQLSSLKGLPQVIKPQGVKLSFLCILDNPKLDEIEHLPTICNEIWWNFNKTIVDDYKFLKQIIKHTKQWSRIIVDGLEKLNKQYGRS